MARRTLSRLASTMVRSGEPGAVRPNSIWKRPEQSLKLDQLTRKKHNAVIKAKGWWWRRSGGPDDRRVGE